MAKNAELKQPDAFIKAGMGLWDHVAQHARSIGIALVALLVAAAIYAGVDAHHANVRAEAGADLARALHIATRPVQGESEEKPETPPAPDDAPFKTETEKQTALAAALKDVIAKHPGTDAARAALVPLGNAQLQLGQLDEAQKSYGDFVAASGDDAPLRALALLGQAKVAEARKDWAAATAAYETLQREAPHSFLKDRAALGKARMLELSGKKQEAANAYQDVKDGFSGTEASTEAGERLAALAAQGFKPPAKLPAAGTDAGISFAPKAE